MCALKHKTVVFVLVLIRFCWFVIVCFGVVLLFFVVFCFVVVLLLYVWLCVVVFCCGFSFLLFFGWSVFI